MKRRTCELCSDAVRLEVISEKNGLDFSRRRDIESHHHINPRSLKEKELKSPTRMVAAQGA